MPLASGTKFGPYEIVETLGAGGMGEVYRARDSRLDRTVAIKVLPDHLSTDADLRARFEREARAISSFQHPHICTLYDVGSENGTNYLVMELVEGETLSARLQRGPMPLKDLLRCGTQIAEALEAAHRRGIVHRDLKPGNIMLTPSGAKLLDFGLAKPLAVTSGNSVTAPSFSAVATMTSPVSPITQQGKVVGTVQYMSPEQIEGKEADARSDIFALGCVLYETATGKRAFEGKSNLSIASAILEKDPEPISSIQPLTPPAFDHVVQRALAKSPDERWQSAADLRGELHWIATSSSTQTAARPAARGRRWQLLLPWAIALIAITFASFTAWRARQLEQPPMLRASIMPPGDGSFAFYGDVGSQPAISPDGQQLVFAGYVNGVQAIYVRDFAGETARMLPGTNGGSFPFWSPDSRQLGYFQAGRMLRYDLEHSTSTFIASSEGNPRGGSWSPNGTIIFAPNFRSPIYAVPASGGEVRKLTQIDFAQHTTHRWPEFLPDGEHFIYLAANHRAPSNQQQNGLYIASLKDGSSKRIVGSLCTGMVVGSHVFFCRENSVFIQELDLSSFALAGEPRLLAPTVQTDLSTWRAFYGVHPNGLMVFAPGTAQPGSELAWHDPTGKRSGRFGELKDYQVISLSRDGRRIAAEVADPSNNIWVGSVQGNTLGRLTSGSAARQPVLSPDGSQVAYSTLQNGKSLVVRKPTSGIGSEETLLESDGDCAPNDWSSDGKYIVVQQGEAGREEYSLHAIQVMGERKVIPMILGGGGQGFDGALSPDMRWFLYSAPIEGRLSVFVSPFDPDVDPKATNVRPQSQWQIATDAGLGKWSHDGKQIYYVSNDGKIMTVPVQATATSFEVGTPRELFAAAIKPIVGMPYAVAPDGRFLVNTTQQPPRAPIFVVSDWRQLLKR
jgi:eukaryotic-like serine/threonine-protein kinase